MSDNRYTDQGESDSQLVTVGDEQIVGMDARTQPERLEPGKAQYLQNMRLDTLAPTVRKGMSKQTNAIFPTGSIPLVIPFTVGTSAIIGGYPSASDGIHASCVFSDPRNNNALYIFMAAGSKVYTFAAATQAVTTINYPANETIDNYDPDTDMFQYGGQVYILRGSQGTAIGVSSITSSAASSATLTTLANHGLSTNMYVRVAGASQSSYNGDFQIVSTGVSTFTYTMKSAPAASPATGTLTSYRLKTPMVWNGNFSSAFTLTAYGQITGNFYYMPTSNWGILQSNRALLQYGRASGIISDINNAESYDILNGVFNFASGTNDYLVGAAPYQDTQTLWFLRQSIYLTNYVNGLVANMTSQLLTNQVGCCSRHSIATCGPDVLFLNERGVFVLQPGYELTLRGNSLPLSAPLDPIIQTINFNALNAPYAAYYLNRYYLAIPTNGATRNNAMIVYNFINKEWESYDTFPNGFYCDEMQVMLNASGVPTLYLISLEGGLYAYEQNEADDYAVASQAPTTYLINGQFKTRRYNLGNNFLKRFTRVLSVVKLNGSASMSATATTIDPTSSRSLVSVTNTAATSAQVIQPSLISKRAYALEILYQNTSGRLQVVNCQVGAYVQDQKSTKIT